MKTVKDDTRRVPVAEIQTHPALQPRALFLVDVRDQARQEKQSDDHVAHMAQLLKADASAELEPITLAEVDGVLFVVDGHHRLRAYRTAKRGEVPATVRTATLRQAHTAAQVANIEGAKLAMHAKQRRNALWQYLAAVTERGQLPLPSGESQRNLAPRFGVARSSVQAMLAKLPEVDPARFPTEHLDAITGWPHWRYATNTPRNLMFHQMTPDARLEWQAGKYRNALLKLWDRHSPEAVALAHRMLQQETAEGDREGDLVSSADHAHALVYDDGHALEF